MRHILSCPLLWGGPVSAEFGSLGPEHLPPKRGSSPWIRDQHRGESSLALGTSQPTASHQPCQGLSFPFSCPQVLLLFLGSLTGSSWCWAKNKKLPWQLWQLTPTSLERRTETDLPPPPQRVSLASSSCLLEPPRSQIPQ